MKLKAITFTQTTVDDEEISTPQTVSVEMSIGEAVAIARVFARFNGYANYKLGVDDASIYECLVGDVLNRYWEDGLNEFGPRLDLATINDMVTPT